MLDILIRGGTVIEGGGRPARRARRPSRETGSRRSTSCPAPALSGDRLHRPRGRARVVEMHSTPTSSSRPADRREKGPPGLHAGGRGQLRGEPAPLTPAQRRRDPHVPPHLPALAGTWTTLRGDLRRSTCQGPRSNVAPPWDRDGPPPGHGTGPRRVPMPDQLRVHSRPTACPRSPERCDITDRQPAARAISIRQGLGQRADLVGPSPGIASRTSRRRRAGGARRRP